MTSVTVLHYLTQWMWLSDSFVFGPISTSRHEPLVVSRMPMINGNVYPPPPRFLSLAEDGEPPAEGRATAELIAQGLWPSRPDLVHVHHGYGLPDATVIAGRLGVPLVVSFWGYDVTALPSKQPERILRHLGVPDVVLVPSQFLARKVMALGVEPARVRVLPGSVDTAFFKPTPLPVAPRVTFVGRFVAKKGVDTLLRAWAQVRRALPEAELTLLGYGDTAPQGNEARGVRVLAPDPVNPRGQVRDLIRQCRVYVSPSQTGPDGDSESQHVGNLEAQAAGRVVLTTDHGAIPEFVEDNVTGVIVPQDDHASLAAEMINLLRDPIRCRRLAREATAAAQRLDVALVSEMHDALYSQLVL